MANKILDKIIAGLSADALRYLFPGLAREDTLHEEVIDGIGQMLNDECTSCISFEEKKTRILTKEGNDDLLFSEKSTQEEEKETVDEDPGIRFRVSSPQKKYEISRSETLGDKPGNTIPEPASSVPHAAKPKAKKASGSPENAFSRSLRRILPEPKPIDLEPDARTKAVLDEIEAIQKKYGITIEELEAALSYRVRLSHLRITRHHAIILDDFDRQEVRMDTLTKAVFLLYLKHPEGIRYKDLCDHRCELENIYMSISGRSDLEGIRKSISDLTDSIMSNSINEKVSKAKKAFRDVVEDRVARFYYIDGKQGAAKSIALDRSLVIWE